MSMNELVLIKNKADNGICLVCVDKRRPDLQEHLVFNFEQVNADLPPCQYWLQFVSKSAASCTLVDVAIGVELI